MTLSMVLHQEYDDKKENRLRCIMQVDCKTNILLVKIGGSSITKKAELETLNLDALDWFSKTIRSTLNCKFLSNIDSDTDSNEKPSIIIVHGAGSFGHHTAKKYGLRGVSSPPPDGMSLTRDSVTGKKSWCVHWKPKIFGKIDGSLRSKKITSHMFSPLYLH